MISEKAKESQTTLNDLVEEIHQFSENITKIDQRQADLKEIRQIQQKALETTEKEIENGKMEKEVLNSKLKELKKKMEERKEVVENTDIIEPISICEGNGNNYNMLNGIVDLNRDILMRLVKLMKNEKKTRNAFLFFCFLFFHFSFNLFYCRSLE
jgi:flagellar motility protein MotE (MotC chaperone)